LAVQLQRKSHVHRTAQPGALPRRHRDRSRQPGRRHRDLRRRGPVEVQTVDAKLQQSATLASGYADIASSNITQVTTANQIATLEIRSDQLSAGKRYARLSVTVGGNAVLIAALALGGEAVEKPASANDVTAVTQRLVM
jgi:hypothetical protein